MATLPIFQTVLAAPAVEQIKIFEELTQPYALFFPGRVESAGSVHSIGGPRGAQLVAAGIAEPAAQPPDIDDGEQVDASPLPALFKVSNDEVLVPLVTNPTNYLISI